MCVVVVIVCFDGLSKYIEFGVWSGKYVNVVIVIVVFIDENGIKN